MRRIGVALVLAGVVLVAASCSLFPSQFGSDYAAINPGGVLGGVFGALLALCGLVLVLPGDRLE